MDKQTKSPYNGVFNVEEDGHDDANVVNDIDRHATITSAHTIDHDSWRQVGLMLVTGFNCGYILSFSTLMLVPLGWYWGLACLAIVGLYTYYANWLLASFHFIDGKRFIRYRDIMGYVFGKHMYYLTWILQFTILILGNMGFILLGGRALKEISLDLHVSWRLQYFIIIAAVAYFLFSFSIPTLSAMRLWLGASTILTSAYIILLLVVLVKDGKSNKNRNYDINGNKIDKAFNALGAIAVTVVCNTAGFLPEIQSTLKKPVVENMRKALNVQFTIGLLFYYGVSIVGYWAYGSSVSWYLPEELSGPKSVKIIVNAAVFLQSIISQHMFLAPVHEAFDTKFLDLDKKFHSKENVKPLFVLRALFYTMSGFVAAAIPFMGDFVNFFGSFALIPLTFVFPSMIFIKVKGNNSTMLKKTWHWFNILFFALLALATTVSAVRLILNNAQEYNFFADS